MLCVFLPARPCHATHRKLRCIFADAEQSGDIFAPSIMLWALGDRLGGLRQLLQHGAKAGGHGPCVSSQVWQRAHLFSLAAQLLPTRETMFCHGKESGVFTALRWVQGGAPTLDAELAIDLLKHCSTRPDLRPWRGALAWQPCVLFLRWVSYVHFSSLHESEQLESDLASAWP